MEEAYEKGWLEKGEGGGGEVKRSLGERKRERYRVFANFVTPAVVLVHSPRVPIVPLSFPVPSFFFLLVAQVLRAFRVSSSPSFFLRSSLPFSSRSPFLSLPNAMLSLAPRLVHRFPRNCIPVSLLSRIVALLLTLSLSFSHYISFPPSLSLSLSHSFSLSRSFHPLYSRSFSPTRRTQYYIPLGPASPMLPPLPYLDTVRARSPPATLEWERLAPRSSRTA